MNAKTQERKFKQTEIGEMPKSWEIKAFDKAVNNNLNESKDSELKSSYKTNGLYPIVDQGNDFIAGYTDDESKVYKECIPIIIFGDHTRVFKYVDFPFVTGADGTKLIKANEEIYNPKFLYYAFKSINIPNRGYNRHFKILKDYFLPCPPKTEQEKIAEVLTKIQKAVENQEKLVKNLKELKSATMAKLFREGLNGEPLKQTEIGEIPKSWEVMRLGEIVDEIFAGGDVPKNNFSKLITDEYKIPIYTNGEKKQGLYGYTNIIKVSKPSLTISSRGTIGYCVLREKPYFPAIRLIVILPNLNIVSLYYLKFAIEINNFEKYFDKSPIPQLTVPMAKRIIIPLPNKDEQEEIANILTSIDNKIEIEGKKLEVYNEFFSSTLNQLMTGKIRVN
ncbi:MAG: hypothetical protein GX445_06995 [Elusimicrobia bacterium]|nr:hypothetical protein [Elusimicrobiota bacterium]